MLDLGAEMIKYYGRKPYRLKCNSQKKVWSLETVEKVQNNGTKTTVKWQRRAKILIFPVPGAQFCFIFKLNKLTSKTHKTDAIVDGGNMPNENAPALAHLLLP